MFSLTDMFRHALYCHLQAPSAMISFRILICWIPGLVVFASLSTSCRETQSPQLAKAFSPHMSLRTVEPFGWWLAGQWSALELSYSAGNHVPATFSHLR